MKAMNDSKIEVQPIIEALRQIRYDEAEQGAIAGIRKAPLFPQLWVLLGEALLHRQYGKAASRAFNRAWLLDPQANWVERVFQQLKSIPAGVERPDIDRLLQYKKVTVTIGIIARDEERSIHRCLSSLQGAAEEIVLIDCESTDRTVDIARTFPNVRIVHTKWNRDFSVLRNEGMAHMSTDWVLWIDADEYLLEEDKTAVAEVAGLYDEMNPVPVLYIWQLNKMAGTTLHEFSQTRMFPLHRGLKYHGRVHEQVGPAEGGLFSAASFRKPVRIRVWHDGYEPDIVQAKNKIMRNLQLLEQAVQEEPDNPGWWTYYARESLAAGLQEQALHGLAEAERTAKDKPAFARLLDVHMLTAKIRIARKEWGLAKEACLKALECDPNFPDAQFYLATVKMNEANQLYYEAEQLLRKSKTSFAGYRGTVSPDHEIANWKADITLADIARAAGKFGDAGMMYRNIADKFPYVKQVSKPLQLMKEQLDKINR
jgi:glycosyltransferase involved in cell wall biosynthesis